MKVLKAELQNNDILVLENPWQNLLSEEEVKTGMPKKSNSIADITSGDKQLKSWNGEAELLLEFDGYKLNARSKVLKPAEVVGVLSTFYLKITPSENGFIVEISIPGIFDPFQIAVDKFAQLTKSINQALVQKIEEINRANNKVEYTPIQLIQIETKEAIQPQALDGDKTVSEKFTVTWTRLTRDEVLQIKGINEHLLSEIMGREEKVYDNKTRTIKIEIPLKSKKSPGKICFNIPVENKNGRLEKAIMELSIDPEKSTSSNTVLKIRIIKKTEQRDVLDVSSEATLELPTSRFYEASHPDLGIAEVNEIVNKILETVGLKSLRNYRVGLI